MELKQEKLDKIQKLSSKMTITDVVELYLKQYIEDTVVDGKRIAGARKKGYASYQIKS
jgi:hypothetical protein